MKTALFIFGFLLLTAGLLNFAFELFMFNYFGFDINLIIISIATCFLLIGFIHKSGPGKEKLSKIKKDIKNLNNKKKHHITLAKTLFVLLILFIASYYFFPDFVEGILKKSPFVYAIFLFIKTNVIMKTYLGLYIALSFGSLFFVYLPLEFVYIYFLTNLNPIFCVFVALLGVLTGFIINYILGLIFAKHIENKKHYGTYSKWMNKFGAVMLLFFYFSPLPEQILTFFAGSLKYNFKKFIIYMGIAILIKYTLLSIYGIKLIEYFTSFIANLI